MNGYFKPETQIRYEIYRHESENIERFELDYIVYSHSSFKDILEIQTDHLSGKGRLTLFIDENKEDLQQIYDRYDKVVFYSPSLPYGERLRQCVSQIDYDYFILMHDIDIAVYIDDDRMIEFVHFLRKNDFDRIDFQLAYDYDESHKTNDDGLYLIRSSNTDTQNKGYCYNVNPSIWKRETLLSILEEAISRGFSEYRTIEAYEIQEFACKFKIFKLFSRKKYRCGYFTCLQPFRYLHITHSRLLFSPSHLPPESSVDIVEDYDRILKKYDLSRWI
jgi:hypothetical protein